MEYITGLKTGIWTGKVVRKIMRLSAVIIYTLVSLVLLTASFTRADAHQSWCHHWHACPSDHSTPYTCGDRGYCRQCPDNAYCQAGRRRSAAPPPPAMTPGMGRPSRHEAVCEGEAPNGAGSNTVTLPTPKGGSNREYKADLTTGGVLPTRPGKPNSHILERGFASDILTTRGLPRNSSQYGSGDNPATLSSSLPLHGRAAA